MHHLDRRHHDPLYLLWRRQSPVLDQCIAGRLYDIGAGPHCSDRTVENGAG